MGTGEALADKCFLLWPYLSLGDFDHYHLVIAFPPSDCNTNSWTTLSTSTNPRSGRSIVAHPSCSLPWSDSSGIQSLWKSKSSDWSKPPKIFLYSTTTLRSRCVTKDKIILEPLSRLNPSKCRDRSGVRRPVMIIRALN